MSGNKIAAVAKEVDRLCKRQSTSMTKSNQAVDSLIRIIEHELSKISDLNHSGATDVDTTQVFATLSEGMKAFQTELKNADKEFASSRIKCEKTIESLHEDFDEVSTVFRCASLDTTAVNALIADHLSQEGLSDVTEEFVRESQLGVPIDERAPYSEMHDIVESLRSGNIAKALEWCELHRGQLRARSSTLVFKLHRALAIQLIRENRINEAIVYCRKHLAQYSAEHLSDIQKLMASTIFAPNVDQSPYKNLFSTSYFDEVISEFVRECCIILGVCVDSPLVTTIKAGSKGLPALVKLASKMKVSKDLQNSEQLPMEVDLGHQFDFHSIFVCPVSREQSTPANPPTLLPCGHILNKQSLAQLIRGGNRFKCPYCPIEGNMSQVRELIF